MMFFHSREMFFFHDTSSHCLQGFRLLSSRFIQNDVCGWDESESVFFLFRMAQVIRENRCHQLKQSSRLSSRCGGGNECSSELSSYSFLNTRGIKSQMWNKSCLSPVLQESRLILSVAFATTLLQNCTIPDWIWNRKPRTQNKFIVVCSSQGSTVPALSDSKTLNT